MTEHSSTSANPLAIRVVRTGGRVKSETALRKQRDVQEQDIALYAYLKAYRLPAYSRAVLIPRGTTGFDPNSEPKLIRAAELAKEGRTVVIDDFRRLIDFSSFDHARDQFLLLRQNIPTLFSIEHYAQLQELTAERIFQILHSEVAKQKIRSRAGQQAAHTAGPVVRKVVSARANARKSRKADRVAEHLVNQIEEIRAHLPSKDQNNKAAIARALEEKHIRTPSRRGRWQSTTVARIYDRAGRPFTSQNDGTGPEPPLSENDKAPE